MKTPISLIIFVLVGNFAVISANEPLKGLVSVYGDQYEGRPTASGELYSGKALTAAHASLPFGTMVRMANFRTGKMLDLRVNDRKAEDQVTFTLSPGAARKLGVTAGATSNVTYQVVGRVAPQTGMQPSQDGEWFNGLHRIGLFNGGNKTGGQSNRVPASSYPENPYYGTTQSNQVATAAAPSAVTGQAQSYAANSQPAPQKKSGFNLAGLFGGNSQPATQANAPTYTAPTYPTQYQSIPEAPNYSATGDLVPLNASAPATTPAPEFYAQPQPLSAVPGATSAAPYRAQFGAFRRQANATETSRILAQQGIGNRVIQSPTTQLYLVVTDSSFSTSGQAQQWIDQEVARRGWRERPVVIR